MSGSVGSGLANMGNTCFLNSTLQVLQKKISQFRLCFVSPPQLSRSHLLGELISRWATAQISEGLDVASLWRFFVRFLPLNNFWEVGSFF